jgi:DNA-directed RNA polymerase specialized sigma24 family protein
MISIASNTTIEWPPKGTMRHTEPESVGVGSTSRDSAASRTASEFEAAARTELPVLYRVARRLCRREEDAEDLVHQCLLQAFRGWNGFDGRHLRSWLIRIMRNEHLGRSKSRQANDDALPLEADMIVSDAPWDAIA